MYVNFQIIWLTVSFKKMSLLFNSVTTHVWTGSRSLPLQSVDLNP